MLDVIARLNAEQLYSRRYFYPSLDSLRIFNDLGFPVAKSVASRVLCMPLFSDLDEPVIVFISKLVKK